MRILYILIFLLSSCAATKPVASIPIQGKTVADNELAVFATTKISEDAQLYIRCPVESFTTELISTVELVPSLPPIVIEKWVANGCGKTLPYKLTFQPRLSGKGYSFSFEPFK
jgi:hypothetical protein